MTFAEFKQAGYIIIRNIHIEEGQKLDMNQLQSITHDNLDSCEYVDTTFSEIDPTWVGYDIIKPDGTMLYSNTPINSDNGDPTQLLQNYIANMSLPK